VALWTRHNSLNFSSLLDFRLWEAVAYEAGLTNSGQTVFGASTSCTKILKDKKYFNTVKIFRGNSALQGRHKLFKILNDKKYIFNTMNSGQSLFSGQAQVVQKS